VRIFGLERAREGREGFALGEIVDVGV
jgi:hypothetical protein